MSESISSKTKSGLIYSGGSIIIRNFLQLFSVSILSRLLTPVDFGIYSIIFVVYSFSLMFAELGLTSAIIQRKDITELQLNTANIFSVCMGVMFTVFLVLSSSFIETGFDVVGLSYYLNIFSIIFVIRSLSMVHEAVLRKELNFRVLISIELLSFIVGNFVISIVMAYYGFGVLSIVFGLLMQTLIASLLSIYLSKFKVRLIFNIRALRDLLTFGIPFTFGRISMYIANQGDNLIIGKLLGASSLGFYNRSFQLMKTPVEFLGGTLSKVLFPAFSKIKEDKVALRSVFLSCAFVNAMFSLPVTLFLWLNANSVIHILLGSQWASSVLPFKILILTLFFRVGYKFIDPIINATGNPAAKARVQFIYAFLVLIGAFVGSYYGLAMVSVLVSLAVVIHYLLMNYIAFQELSININMLGAELKLGVFVSSTYGFLHVISEYCFNIEEYGPFVQIIYSLLILVIAYGTCYVIFKNMIFSKINKYKKKSNEK